MSQPTLFLLHDTNAERGKNFVPLKSGHFIYGEHMFYCYDLLLEKSVLYRLGAAYSANRRIMFLLESFSNDDGDGNEDIKKAKG